MIAILTKPRAVASFGAFVTIVALGINTFAQQSLEYITVYPATGDAYMPIAQYVNGSGFAPIGNNLAGKNVIETDIVTHCRDHRNVIGQCNGWQG